MKQIITQFLKRWAGVTVSVLLLMGAVTAWGEERFPPPDFRGGYKIPVDQYVPARADMWQVIDAVMLVWALVVAGYVVLYRRSRTGVFWLTVACLAYFGFYRQGCVCSVGSLQNVALALGDGGYTLPWTVGFFFAVPLVAALFLGRIFCAGVCPLGAIQDVVLWRPKQVPEWVEMSLGLFAHIYLGLAVLFAAISGKFIICEWDPFVGFFRFSGSVTMLLLGAGLLLVSMFVGRVYCRFVCPYGVLLRLLAPLAKWKVHVSPKECIDCRLCEKACPFGAIDKPTRETVRVAKDVVRRRLLVAIVVFVSSTVGLGALGYFSSGVLAKVDRTVQLAERVYLEEQGMIKGASDESNSWRKTGQSGEELAITAGKIKRKYAWGGAMLGVWVGLAVGLRFVRLTVPQYRKEYDAQAGACVGCARCYRSCPVEQERLGLIAAGTAVKVKEAANI